MSDYESAERKEFWKWVKRLLLAAVLVIATIGALTGVMGGFGKIGNTMIENEVFQRSYQKQSADDASLARYKAELINIETLLGNNPENPKTLEARAMALRSLIAQKKATQ